MRGEAMFGRTLWRGASIYLIFALFAAVSLLHCKTVELTDTGKYDVAVEVWVQAVEASAVYAESPGADPEIVGKIYNAVITGNALVLQADAAIKAGGSVDGWTAQVRLAIAALRALIPEIAGELSETHQGRPEGGGGGTPLLLALGPLTRGDTTWR
jgi:hypothetical protein